MIWFLLILVSGIIVYLYYKHLDESTKDTDRDFALAVEHYSQAEYTKAIIVWTELIKKHPTHYQLWNNRGEAYYQLGRFEEALLDFKKSTELSPGRQNNSRAYGNIEKVLHTLNKIR